MIIINNLKNCSIINEKKCRADNKHVIEYNKKFVYLCVKDSDYGYVLSQEIVNQVDGDSIFQKLTDWEYRLSIDRINEYMDSKKWCYEEHQIEKFNELFGDDLNE